MDNFCIIAYVFSQNVLPLLTPILQYISVNHNSVGLKIFSSFASRY